MGGRAAAPKGMKSCRTQGTFVRLSVRPPPQTLLGLKSALLGLKSAFSGLKSSLSGLESEKADFRAEKADSRPERADFRPERADFRPERADFRPERADFRSERTWGGADGQTDGRTDVQTDGRTKVPCVLQDFVPFGAAAQKAEGTNSWTDGWKDGWTNECPVCSTGVHPLWNHCPKSRVSLNTLPLGALSHPFVHPPLLWFAFLVLNLAFSDLRSVLSTSSQPFHASILPS